MAVDTPTGQQPADDAAALGYHPNWWRAWEQGGVSTTAGFKDESLDPAGHYSWRVARSTANKTKGEFPA